MVEEEDVGDFTFAQRTVGCFGKGKPLNLLTLIQGLSILSGTQSGRQLVTWLGLCSRSGLLVRSETASTCWVFALTSIVLIMILAFESSILQERTKFSLASKTHHILAV